MEPEEIERALTELKDPTTAPVLAKALGYGNSTAIANACRSGRIPGAEKRGWIWLIPMEGVYQAIRQGTLRPGWKQSKSGIDTAQV